MDTHEFSELCMVVYNNLHNYGNDKEYMKDSHVKSDGTYVLQGRHLDFMGHIDKDTPDSDLPRQVNNLIVDRFHLNRYYYTPKGDEKSCKVRFATFPVSDKKAAKIVSENISRRYEDVPKQIKAEIEWVRGRFTNVNDVNLSNILEALWYDHRGVFNTNIQDEIKKQVNRLAEVGQINIW